MIKREIEAKLSRLIKEFPVVTLTGPRQSGKTTVVQELLGKKYRYVSLEDLDMREFARQDPRGFLADYDHQVIIDEAQNVPELFSYIQGVVDRNQKAGQYILTGSQHFLLLEKISQSLAGRTAILHLLPLSISEIQKAGVELPSMEHTLLKGFYPRLFASRADRADWYSSYVRTYVERDLRQMKSVHDLGTFQTFLKMCASRTGQLLDLTSIGNDCGISHPTVRSWINILEASFIVFLLRPHHANFGKRLIKSPKLYFYDTGLLAHLLGIHSAEELSSHYLKGGIFESFVMAELLKSRFNEGKEANIFFWRDKSDREVDCIVEEGGKLLPVEVKSSKTISTHFFENLEYWSSIAGEASKKGYLVYGGNQDQKRTIADVLSWNNIYKIARMS